MNSMKSYLGAAIFSIFAVASAATHATTYEASVVYNGPPGPVSVTMQDSTWAFAQLSSNVDPVCGAGYYRTCAASAYSGGTEVSSSGIGTLTATSGFTDTWTNTSGQTQNYTFDFNLYSTNSIYSWNGQDFAQTGFSATILLNGTSIWATARALELGQNGGHYSGSGADIGSGPFGHIPFTDINNYHTYATADDYTSSVNLGSFAAGATFSIQYIFSSYTISTDSNLCGWECFTAQASTVGFGAVHQVSAVPEPESYALLLMGLTVIGAARRRKNKSA